MLGTHAEGAKGKERIMAAMSEDAWQATRSHLTVGWCTASFCGDFFFGGRRMKKWIK
jgi:hypothetical protein